MVSFRLRPLLAATALVVLSTFAIQKPVYAQDGEGFTGADLMGWSENNRYVYLDTALGMAVAILAQDQSGYGTCVSDWYFRDATSLDAARREIEAVLQRFPDNDPRGVLIALIRQNCGPLPLQNGD